METVVKNILLVCVWKIGRFKLNSELFSGLSVSTMNTHEIFEVIVTICVGFGIVAVLLSCYVRFFRKMCCTTSQSKPRKCRRRLSCTMDSVTNITLISCQQTDDSDQCLSGQSIATENL